MVLDPKEYVHSCEAYLTMAEEANYRPQAEADRFGNIASSSQENLADQRLTKEASEFARRFIAEEETRRFRRHS